MRVLFCIKSMATAGGGAERVLADLANGLAVRSHEVGIVTFDEAAPSFYALDGRVEKFALRFCDVGQSISKGRLLWALPRIRRSVLDFKPDVCVALMHSSYVPVSLALCGTGIPVVASEHTTPEHFRGRMVESALIRATSRLVAARTVVSEPVRSAFLRSRYPAAEVLSNPVDLDRFMAAGESASPDESRTVLVVGGMRAEKAHSDAIAAFSRVANAFPHWTLRIVGEGSLRPALERQVLDLGLSDRVEMPGVCREMVEEYKRAAFMFVSSRYESFGLAAAEAMASARPVLAAQDCLGVAALIESGVNGLLVSGGERRVEAFAEGLSSLMSDASLRARLGASAPYAVRRFTKQNSVLEWERFLRQYECSPS